LWRVIRSNYPIQLLKRREDDRREQHFTKHTARFLNVALEQTAPIDHDLARLALDSAKIDTRKESQVQTAIAAATARQPWDQIFRLDAARVPVSQSMRRLNVVVP